MLIFENRVERPDLLLGVVRAEGLSMAAEPEGFAEVLAESIDRRRRALTPAEEQTRAAVRNLLRNGAYRPTGRGKPASEYLVRAAGPDEQFPRINAAVDVCNFISLKTLLPISLWDLDLAATDRFVFRLGRTGEQYVFNEGGQEIALEGLITGCSVAPGDAAEGTPIVTPVKDSLATKTVPGTSRVAACIYAPATVVSVEQLEQICREFTGWLARCGVGVETARGSVAAGAEGRC